METMSNPHPQNYLAGLFRALDRECNDLVNLADDLVEVEDLLWTTARADDPTPEVRARRRLGLGARHRAA